MLTLGDYIYIEKNGNIKQIHIKFKTVRYIRKFDHTMISPLFIVVLNKMMSKYEIYEIKTLNKIFSFENNCTISKILLILRKILIFNIDSSITVCDVDKLELTTYDCPIKITNLCYSIHCKTIIILQPQFNYILVSFDEFIDCLKTGKFIHKQIINSIYGTHFIKNNKEIISIISGITTKIIIRDMSFNCKYNINVDYIDFNTMKINVFDDVAFVWNENVIVVIDGLNVWSLPNDRKLISFNEEYGIFIDNRRQFYKYCDKKLIRYELEYDYWRDVDKPTLIVDIMEVLMLCNVFTYDVINEIYKVWWQ